MKDLEITALAREYAEEIWPTAIDKTAGYKTREALRKFRERESEKAERIIRFLLRRFYLVEKEAVRNAYKAARCSFNNASDPVMPTMEFHNGEMSAIESLFPDLGKEVES